jgi:hypothetical protein
MMLLQPYYYARACVVDSYYHFSNEAKALAVRHKPSSSEPWQEKESRSLVEIYSSRPSWSYGDIAEQLYRELRLWDTETRRTRSSRACARRLRVLYHLGHLDHNFMSHGAPLSWWTRHSSDLLLASHLRERPSQTKDSAVNEAENALCTHCKALRLGKLHMQRRNGYGDGVTGDTGGHPASQTVQVLRKSSRECPCCNFILAHLRWPDYVLRGAPNLEKDELQLSLQILFQKGLRHTFSISYSKDPASGTVRRLHVLYRCCQILTRSGHKALQS